MTQSRSRRRFAPLVVLGSLLWVALVVAGDVLQFRLFASASVLPQSVGCSEPGPAPISRLRAKPGPCHVLAPINPPLRRRDHHDQDRIDPSIG